MYSRKIKKTRRLTDEGEKKRIYTVYKGEGEGISACGLSKKKSRSSSGRSYAFGVGSSDLRQQVKLPTLN
ncbi:MAG: hypothetical protein D3913_00820 [Candidatus Electrothrix sp. LOE1_4_5]|nr:hypothetical protein [Candidatus Electrothrix gigas]